VRLDPRRLLLRSLIASLLLHPARAAAAPRLAPRLAPNLGVRVVFRVVRDGATEGASSISEARFRSLCVGRTDPVAALAHDIAGALDHKLPLHGFDAETPAPPDRTLVFEFEFYDQNQEGKLSVALGSAQLPAQRFRPPGYRSICGPGSPFTDAVIEQTELIRDKLLADLPIALTDSVTPDLGPSGAPAVNTGVPLDEGRLERINLYFRGHSRRMVIDSPRGLIEFVACIYGSLGERAYLRGPHLTHGEDATDHPCRYDAQRDTRPFEPLTISDERAIDILYNPTVRP
jgi:hypothetical protein